MVSRQWLVKLNENVIARSETTKQSTSTCHPEPSSSTCHPRVREEPSFLEQLWGGEPLYFMSKDSIAFQDLTGCFAVPAQHDDSLR